MFTTRTLITHEQKKILAQLSGISGEFSLFNPDIANHRIFIAAFDDKGQIVGIAQLIENSARVNNAIGIGFIETRKSFRNMGVASVLVKEIFELANKMGKSIANTYYEPDGERWLRHVMQRQSQIEGAVALFEKDEVTTTPSTRNRSNRPS